MGWLSLSLNCPLTQNPITPFLHLSFQQLFDRKSHEKRRKAFPRSCPLKIKDSVALSPDQMNAWRHLKFRNPSGISPLSKNDLASLWNTVHHYVSRTKIQEKAHEHYIFTRLGACSTGQQRPRNTLWNMCVWKRRMGVQSGVLQGLGSGIVKPPPLSHTPPSTSLLSSASQSWLLWGSG